MEKRNDILEAMAYAIGQNVKIKNCKWNPERYGSVSGQFKLKRFPFKPSVSFNASRTDGTNSWLIHFCIWFDVDDEDKVYAFRYELPITILSTEKKIITNVVVYNIIYKTLIDSDHIIMRINDDIENNNDKNIFHDSIPIDDSTEPINHCNIPTPVAPSCTTGQPSFRFQTQAEFMAAHPLKPLEPIMHREITDLDEITGMYNGVCLKIARASVDGSGAKTDSAYMESTYVKSYLKEELANGRLDDVQFIRYYSELGTEYNIAKLKEELANYKIPANHLKVRNDCDDNPIDENGCYINSSTKPEAMTEDTEKENEVTISVVYVASAIGTLNGSECSVDDEGVWLYYNESEQVRVYPCTSIDGAINAYCLYNEARKDTEIFLYQVSGDGPISINPVSTSNLLQEVEIVKPTDTLSLEATRIARVVIGGFIDTAPSKWCWVDGKYIESTVRYYDIIPASKNDITCSTDIFGFDVSQSIAGTVTPVSLWDYNKLKDNGRTIEKIGCVFAVAEHPGLTGLKLHRSNPNHIYSECVVDETTRVVVSTATSIDGAINSYMAHKGVANVNADNLYLYIILNADVYAPSQTERVSYHHLQQVNIAGDYVLERVAQIKPVAFIEGIGAMVKLDHDDSYISHPEQVVGNYGRVLYGMIPDCSEKNSHIPQSRIRTWRTNYL